MYLLILCLSQTRVQEYKLGRCAAGYFLASLLIVGTRSNFNWPSGVVSWGLDAAAVCVDVTNLEGIARLGAAISPLNLEFLERSRWILSWAG